jgi:hypothetical protein
VGSTGVRGDEQRGALGFRWLLSEGLNRWVSSGGKQKLRKNPKKKIKIKIEKENRIGDPRAVEEEWLGELRAAEGWSFGSPPKKKKKTGQPLQQRVKVGDRKKKKKSKKKNSARRAESWCKAAEGRMARRAKSGKPRDEQL